MSKSYRRNPDDEQFVRTLKHGGRIPEVYGGQYPKRKMKPEKRTKMKLKDFNNGDTEF